MPFRELSNKAPSKRIPTTACSLRKNGYKTVDHQLDDNSVESLFFCLLTGMLLVTPTQLRYGIYELHGISGFGITAHLGSEGRHWVLVDPPGSGKTYPALMVFLPSLEMQAETFALHVPVASRTVIGSVTISVSVMIASRLQNARAFLRLTGFLDQCMVWMLTRHN